jgi:signal transduction histidine kinase
MMIYLLSDLRHHDMKVRLFNKLPPVSAPNSALIQKGFLGIKVLGLTKVITNKGREAWLEAVAPIEAKKAVKKIVAVSFPLTPMYLAEVRYHTNSDITLLLPNVQTISTLSDEIKVSLLEQVKGRQVLDEKFEKPIMFNTTSPSGPSKTLIRPFLISLKREGFILFTMPMGDLLAAKKTIFFKGLLATLIIFSAASLLYLSLIRRITKPLEELSSATHEISRGKLDLQVGVDTQDEVGELASSFNTMVQRLKESRAEIEEWNRTLERRVEDRTRSLQQAQTELKALNEQLIQALEELRETQDKMIHTEKMAALGQMASTIAHEIHNPLAGMRGALEVLMKEQTDSGQTDVLSKVLDQIDRLSQTTSRLLTFARPAKPQRTPTDLADLIEKTSFFILDQARRKGVEIVLDIEQIDHLFSLDPQLTNQAFLNIALNAIQAMENGGTLTIATKWLSEDGAVIVSFSDTGKGMTPEVRDKIFSPFYTTKRYGTGLGLYVVKDIVEQQGGSVSVSSTPGKGTVVTIKLPAKESLSSKPAS